MVTLDGIKKILAKGGIPFLGMGQYYACPADPLVVFDDPEWRRTLRIFPSLNGDPLFRCWDCGTCLDALQLYARLLKKPLAEVATIMFNEGMVTRPYTEAELERYEWVSRLMRSIWKGQQRYEHGVANGLITPMYGEWLSCNTSTDPVPLPPSLKPTRKINGEYFLRLLRDVFGRVVKAELWSERLLPLGVFRYWDAPITLAMPPWTVYRDLNEIVVCDLQETAAAVENMVASWPQEQRIPIALPVDLDCFPITTQLPFEKVWFVCREDNVWEMGLAFYRRGMTEVKIRQIEGTHNQRMPPLTGISREEFCSPDLPDCIDAVVGRILHGTQETLSSRLGRVLGRRYLPGDVKREIFRQCASGAGIAKDTLLNQLEADANPFSLRDKGRLFVCRNGRYFSRDRKGHWSEISNFEIQSIAKTVNRRGNAIHELLLSVDGFQTTFKVTDALLDSPPRLWKAARQAAALGGLPELLMQNAQHRHLLPSLVKSTADTSCPPKF